MCQDIEFNRHRQDPVAIYLKGSVRYFVMSCAFNVMRLPATLIMVRGNIRFV